MAFYQETLTIYPNTSRTDPEEKTLHIGESFIESVRVFFPNGCNNKVNVAVRVGDTTVFPSQQTRFVSGDGEKVGGIVTKDLTSYEPEITLIGWSEADTFPHEVRFDIETLRDDQKFWRRNLATVASVLSASGNVVRSARNTLNL